MGKRSTGQFAREPRDYYPTPAAAVAPLLPHLPAACCFVEPCAGNGALVDHLTGAGHRCPWAFDIAPQRDDIKRFDAFDMRLLGWQPADFIITNPPWSRPILHRMILHFSAQRPTWLLFDADWIHTRQSAPFLPLLRKIVSVGRVKWRPETSMTGKDNCAWHLFDQNSAGATVFVGRAA